MFVMGFAIYYNKKSQKIQLYRLHVIQGHVLNNKTVLLVCCLFISNVQLDHLGRL